MFRSGWMKENTAMAGLFPWNRTKEQLLTPDSEANQSHRTRGESAVPLGRPDPAVIPTDGAGMVKASDGVTARERKPLLAQRKLASDPTPSTDLEVYATRVELARLSHSSDIILNSSHGHAAVLIQKLFQAANKEIHVLCRNLNPPVYGEEGVIDAAREFFKRDGAVIKILVQDEEALSEQAKASNAFLREFDGHPNVSIRSAPETTAPFNFFVVDTDGFRFEPDKDEPVARASFNNPDLSQRLRDYFKLLEMTVQGNA